MLHKLLLTSMLILLAADLFSQTSTSSPYSIYGIGDPEPKTNPAAAAMGGAKYAFISPYYINNANPSSYSVINIPMFQVDAASNFLQISSTGSEESVNNTYLKNIAFAFPLKKNRWGMSFGLLPYSKMGYNITDQEEIENYGTVDYLYEGDGNISQIYFGHGFRLFGADTGRHQLSIGANGYYMFGALRKMREVSPQVTNAFDVRELNQANVNDVHIDFGFNYRLKLSKQLRLTLGGNYSISDNLKGKNVVFATTYFTQGVVETLKDTARNDTLSGNIHLPQAIGLGVGLHVSNKLFVQADYYTQDWTDYVYFGETDHGLQTQSRFSAGAQYVPDLKEVNSFFKTIRYRVGFRTEKTRLQVKGQQLSETGINFGVGIPLAKGESAGTSLNVAAEFGSRGTTNNSLIKERFTNLSIGFTFTPHKFDQWFLKRKIE